jgi:hypothetical protein
MLVEFKGDLGLEGQPRAFEDDLGSEFIPHGYGVVAVAVGVSVGGAVVIVGVAVAVAVGVIPVVAEAVGVIVFVAGVTVPVFVVVTVVVPLPKLMITYNSSPKAVPLAADMRQLPRTEPVLFGAVMGTETSISAPEATLWPRVLEVPPMASPPVEINLKPDSQAQLPELRTFHVLVNV